LAVAVFRLQTEDRTKRVEVSMDYQDFAALARSYDYNPAGFLIALRRAGLTSLALTEELGSNVGDDGKAQVLTGASLRNQRRSLRSAIRCSHEWLHPDVSIPARCISWSTTRSPINDIACN
jgi:hypothetical protein